MSEQANESTNTVLASLHRRFIDETSGVNGLFFESILKTQEQLANLVIGDDSEQLLAKSSVVHGGINDWLESLVKLVHKYAGTLVDIIVNTPQVSSGDDPARWIRLWLEKHLREHLGQELNLQKRAAATRSRKIVENVLREKLEEGLMPSQFPAPVANDSSRKCAWSRVEGWLRGVADDLPDFDQSPTGYDEPWLAPSWCDEEEWIKVRLKRHDGYADRLTLEQTARLIHSFENKFAGRLEHILSVEEDKARITFAVKKRIIVSQEEYFPPAVRPMFVGPQAQQLAELAIRSLHDEISEADRVFSSELSKHSFWAADADEPITRPKSNRDYFEPHKDRWIKAVKQSISKTLESLINIGTGEGLPEQEAVQKAFASLQALVDESFRPEVLLGRIAIIGRCLPDGISETGFLDDFSADLKRANCIVSGSGGPIQATRRGLADAKERAYQHSPPSRAPRAEPG